MISIPLLIALSLLALSLIFWALSTWMRPGILKPQLIIISSFFFVIAVGTLFGLYTEKKGVHLPISFAASSSSDASSASSASDSTSASASSAPASSAASTTSASSASSVSSAASTTSASSDSSVSSSASSSFSAPASFWCCRIPSYVCEEVTPPDCEAPDIYGGTSEVICDTTVCIAPSSSSASSSSASSTSIPAGMCDVETLCGDGRIVLPEICDDGGICTGSTHGAYEGQHCFDIGSGRLDGVQRCVATDGSCVPVGGDGCSADCLETCFTDGETCFVKNDCGTCSESCCNEGSCGSCVASSSSSASVASSASSSVSSISTSSSSSSSSTSASSISSSSFSSSSSSI